MMPLTFINDQWGWKWISKRLNGNNSHAKIRQHWSHWTHWKSAHFSYAIFIARDQTDIALCNERRRKKIYIYIYSSLKSCNPWVVDYGFAFSIRVYIESFKNPTVLRKCILNSDNSYSYSYSSSLQSKSYRCRKIGRKRDGSLHLLAFLFRVGFFLLLLSIYFECLSLFCSCSFIYFRMKELLSVVG